MTVDLTSLNYLAIVAAGLAALFLGGLWYTALFGKAWQRLHGYSDAQVKAMQAARPMPVFFGGMIACYAVSALALAILVQGLGISGALAGAGVGLVVWAAVAAFAMTGHLAGPKPIGVYLIDAGFGLVFLPVIGAIIGAWR